jgi:hypothetical protein
MLKSGSEEFRSVKGIKQGVHYSSNKLAMEPEVRKGFRF